MLNIQVFHYSNLKHILILHTHPLYNLSKVSKTSFRDMLKNQMIYIKDIYHITKFKSQINYRN